MDGKSRGIKGGNHDGIGPSPDAAKMTVVKKGSEEKRKEYSCMFCDWTSETRSGVKDHISSLHSFDCAEDNNGDSSTSGSVVSEREKEKSLNLDNEPNKQNQDYETVLGDGETRKKFLKNKCEYMFKKKVYKSTDKVWCKGCGKTMVYKCFTQHWRDTHVKGRFELVRKGPSEGLDLVKCLKCEDVIQYVRFPKHWEVKHCRTVANDTVPFIRRRGSRGITNLMRLLD